LLYQFPNWLPLVRSALYGLGEDLHIAIWPGNDANTRDITRFIASESRSYVLSVGGLMRKKDITPDIPHAELIADGCPDLIANGGSCIAGPDGEWIIEPQTGSEEIFTATLNYNKIRQERHNFDPSGHYSRPDVTQLIVNRKRQSTIKLDGEEMP
jgi:nitrilase